MQRPTTVGAGHFKSKCLKLLDEVKETRQPLIITKHGKAVAKLVPMPAPVELFGAMRGEVLSEDDIISPAESQWNAVI